MDKINQRILEVREKRGLNQENFAARLGVTKSAISGYETGRRNPTQQIIKAICREFHVDEKWLCTGNGIAPQEQESNDPSDLIEMIIYEYECNNFEASFLRSYFQLDFEERTNLTDALYKTFDITIKYIEENKLTPSERATSTPKLNANFVSLTDINNASSLNDAEAPLDVDEDEYKKSILDSASKTEHTASNTIEGTERKNA